MVLFSFFFYLLVSNEELQSRIKFEGRPGFSCPVQTAMLVPRKGVDRVHLAQIELNMSRV